MNNPYTLTNKFLHKNIYHNDGTLKVESTELKDNLSKCLALMLFMLIEEQNK